MDLKQRLDHYGEEPAPEVWENIATTLQKQAGRRRAIVGAVAGVLLLAAVGGTLTLRHHSSADNQTAVAQNESSAPESTTVATIPESTPVVSVAPAQATNQEVTPVSESTMTNATTKEAPATVVAAQSPVTEMTVAERTERPVAAKSAPVQSQTVKVQSKAVAESAPVAQSSASVAQSTESVKVNVAPAEDEVAFWKPNAFTPDDPNGDNTRWQLELRDGRHVKSFKIFLYSRSGRQVYKSTDYNQSWDGIANGQPQPAGAYTYVYEYYDIDLGRLVKDKGTVLLIR